MLTIKVPLKDAEKVKKYLLNHKFLDFNYSFLKDKGYMFFPVIKKTSLKYDHIQKEIKPKTPNLTFKDELQKILSEDELDKVKTAFDNVGDIAILEIDDVLRRKEKQIAECLLNTNPQIKTVLRKNGAHEGEFRTQKMKHLVGEKTKETIHKENNIKLKLDVENVYFSVRLSTERKRISNLVKKDEVILVMFSGCAPYPTVLAKNTDAKFVYGIELNPKGHKYGIENIKLNKLNNVFLVNGDVKDIVPNFYQNIIGLKSANIAKEMDIKLAFDTNVFEFHTFTSDFEDKNFVKLKKSISKLKKENKFVVVHQPLDGEPLLDLTHTDSSNIIYKLYLPKVSVPNCSGT